MKARQAKKQSTRRIKGYRKGIRRWLGRHWRWTQEGERANVDPAKMALFLAANSIYGKFATKD